MPVFDIGSIVMSSDNIWERPPGKNLTKLVEWLGENVGEFYGTGDDHTVDYDRPKGSTAIRIGAGWEIIKDWKGDPDGYVEVWWKLDITDESKATLFALKWIK